MRPAVILARVSTPEQEAGHSLEAQLANLESYAERRDLEVIQVFRIIESSTKGYRPEFERMIEFLSKQKQRTALIIDCVDRLQRNFTHTPVLNGLMEKNLLEIHFVREGNVIDKDANSMQKMMWNMGAVMAQSYTDQLSDNVRRSIKHKLEKGEWIAQAPLGYLNTTDSVTGRTSIVIDPQRASLVQRLFVEYAAGVSSMTELRQKTLEWGLLSRNNKPLTLQTIFGLLNNPFYCGLMRIKGHLYPHSYPQLVDNSVFRACEKRKRNPKQAIKLTRYPFVLRGLVTCAVSGRKATCSLQKGRYVYLMARDPANPAKKVWVKEESVLQQLDNVLRSFALPEEFVAMALDYIKSSHEAEKELHLARIKELRIEDSNLADKSNRLMDLMIEGHVEQKLFEAKNKEITFRRREIACILDDNIVADEKFKDALCKILSLVAISGDLFESSKTDEKRGLLGFVFSNLQLEGPILRYTLRKPFEVFAQLPHNPEWRATEDDQWHFFINHNAE
jgi:DNA invertase Pin-like site-specific DNA recombinase